MINCLEEYDSGEYVEIQFTEEEYKTFYFDMIDNLTLFSASKSQAHQVDRIRRDMFRAGMYVHLTAFSRLCADIFRKRMGGLRARRKRTTGPFIPSSPAKGSPAAHQSEDEGDDAQRVDRPRSRHRKKAPHFEAYSVSSPPSEHEDFGALFENGDDGSEDEEEYEVDGPGMLANIHVGSDSEAEHEAEDSEAEHEAEDSEAEREAEDSEDPDLDEDAEEVMVDTRSNEAINEDDADDNDNIFYATGQENSELVDLEPMSDIPSQSVQDEDEGSGDYNIVDDRSEHSEEGDSGGELESAESNSEGNGSSDDDVPADSQQDAFV